jgi:Tripartite tricarboxylate transporter family receptor
VPSTSSAPVAEKMKSLLGTIIVENIGGGGSSLGALNVVRASPDGYTLLLGGTQTHVNEALLKNRPLYDPVKGLDPIRRRRLLLCHHDPGRRRRSKISSAIPRLIRARQRGSRPPSC